jgi:copper chaperone NosL
MSVSDPRFAAEIVAAGEEPLFFDDIGCLANHLAKNAAAPGSVVYVADHRTGAWVRAASAIFSYAPEVPTPMGSHVIAHASPDSRNADASARAAQDRSPVDLFGGALSGISHVP